MSDIVLTPEQANAELDRLAVAHPEMRALRRSLLLTGKAQAVVRLVLTERSWEHREEIGQLLDGMSERARRRTFRALHPGLADVLAPAWVALGRQPYTSGYTRRAFRAPAIPELTAAERAGWLQRVLQFAGPYDKRGPAWLAAWAGRLGGGWGAEPIGRLLGAAIDHGQSDVYDVLLATMRGEHEVALMGRHVPVALLSCANPDAWQQVERLLLSARRQEGLRQSILEAADLAHPQAFRRLICVLVEHDMTRFAATVRAVGVWLGEPFEVTDRKRIDALLADLAVLLDDPQARASALTGDDPARTYLALWSVAFDDAVAAVGVAHPLLAHPSAEQRLAAARVLAAVQLPASRRALVSALADADPRVVAAAVEGQSPEFDYTDLEFAALRALVERLPSAQVAEIGLWKPQQLKLDPATIADHLAYGLGQRPPRMLDNIAHRMTAGGRERYAAALAKDPGRHRATLLKLVGDRAPSVRQRALKALSDGPAPTVEEATALESLLTRRGGDLRRGVLTLLLRQGDPQAVDSVRRLREGKPGQADAGRELADELRSANRAIIALGVPPSKPSDEATTTSPAPDDLIDHKSRTPALPPAANPGWADRFDAGVRLVLTSLDAWLAEHRDVEVTVTTWTGPEVQLLSNLQWLRGPDQSQDWASQREHQPLREVTEAWWERTSSQLTDGGGEVALAWAAVTACGTAQWSSQRPRWTKKVLAAAGHLDLVRTLNYAALLGSVLQWYAVREARPSWVDWLLAAAEDVLHHVTGSAIKELPRVAEGPAWYGRRLSGDDWRNPQGVCAWLNAATALEQLRPELWTPSQRGRLWRLLRFVDEPQGVYDPATGGREPSTARTYGPQQVDDLPRRPARRHPPLQVAARAVDAGVATTADVRELLTGERVAEDQGPMFGRQESSLGTVTRRNRPPWVANYPWLLEIVDDVRERIVDAEAHRGELPTPWSKLAQDVRSVDGVDTVARLMAALGRQKLVRGYSWGDHDSKASTLSSLIRQCFPKADENADGFAATVRAHRLSDQQLRDVAVYAPQWAPFVEATLNEPGLADAVHWLHAHTKDDQWSVDQDIREAWVAATHERTELEQQDLVNGAVDVAWLTRVLNTLGDDRFDQLLKAAKYASTAGGHKRAELFAQAARGNVDRNDLVDRITGKRHQDSVRALGLLPLPHDPDARSAELLARYQLLCEWRDQSKKFGQQRRASEELAVRIGMENLARTAGYRDPQRLTWAMEAESVRDLAAGPVTATDGDLSVALSLDDLGSPQLAVRRGERTLKAIPKTAAKNEAIGELKTRVADLRKQFRRMRTSLEETAVRGDRFTVAEFAELMGHPMLAPQLRDLVLISDEGLHGFPHHGGVALVGHDGIERALDRSPLRIAHPVDLLHTDEWSQWQHTCFTRRLRQPFKQVFRELYLPTAAERDGATRSERYAGHQVNPRQAIALLGSRRWIVNREDGAMRTFHDERLTARLSVMNGLFTPAEVEGMTIESVTFTPVGEWKPVPLETVPPRLFSEVMRDIDLVVSVAHAGGVDPEASESTTEMRGSLVQETAEMLSLNNVELTDHHALVQGKLGTYSVHLGSGVVHRRPGNALCIIPVGAQHRGRLFLPFVDDDPRTAEIVSKVVLLARDDKIRDPTILEQLS